MGLRETFLKILEQDCRIVGMGDGKPDPIRSVCTVAHADAEPEYPKSTYEAPESDPA